MPWVDGKISVASALSDICNVIYINFTVLLYEMIQILATLFSIAFVSSFYSLL